MRVCVIGTGYVGLVTGVCLAHIGHDVICVDNNEAKVKVMQSGTSPIYEPGLSEIMQSAMSKGNLEFTTNVSTAIANSQILFIAVGTPALPTGESDTRYVEAVARSIGFAINGEYKVIVNKSTVPIGSGDWVRQIINSEIEQRNLDTTPQFDVVSNPEFLREGSAIYDTFNPDRIVLGGNSSEALSLMKELYQPIVERAIPANDAIGKLSAETVPVVTTDLNSAETIKYAANSFLATKISFINELANICGRVGADVVQVAQGIGLDSRIGNKFLQAGIGWGGSCFPKDVSALIHTADDYGYDAQLLKATVRVNTTQRLLAVEKLQQVLKILKGKTVGLLGLTFKPDTDDLRDAPAINLIEELNRLGAKVKAYDPLIQSPEHHSILSTVDLETTPDGLVNGCDALVLVTNWQEFANWDYVQLAKQMNTPIMIDGRNYLDANVLAAAGFYYIGIGRPTAGNSLVTKRLQHNSLSIDNKVA
ncbi:UDP-glucose 6-dehydrogenase TuaD [Hyella patelloides LEGE 07179]|uniref:UDP-glucose 6-dehydrogenase n=1 Tax=Hyella patelloides LEGE 07179 TaxID=945734 RepID=A0A563VJ51_9CYAN|nr:UDP-glucose/GDP-mannose dehydrogenase family protein [Hyella patelloides]VEP11480.1 UDP-glucose 6-dehydrogenase TuaD [Hyella patelloides LEGE 07179]